MERRNSRPGFLPEPEMEMAAHVNDLLEKFELTPKQLVSITKLFRRDCQFGLRTQTNPQADIKMLPSYVTKINAEFSEPKSFLALDLGGTNFRVLLVEVEPSVDDRSPVCKIDSKIYKVYNYLMTEHGSKLFEHIAACIADFIKLMKIEKKSKNLPIGFTFSFPCVQTSLNASKLLTWTKGFNCPGVVGENIGELLAVACRNSPELMELGVSINVSAICNDTVGTLMSCVFEEPDCMIGLIAGTGSNACYLEKTKNIELIDKSIANESENMVINCEWGNFGASGSLFNIQSPFDIKVDAESPNPGKQIFEKMISGMYLGELVRLTLLQLHKIGVVFYDECITKLEEKGSFETALVSGILSCGKEDAMEIQNLIASHLEIGAVFHDCEVVYQVCEVISKRAAMLCACGVAGLVYMIAAPQKRTEWNDEACELTLDIGETSGFVSTINSPITSRQASGVTINNMRDMSINDSGAADTQQPNSSSPQSNLYNPSQRSRRGERQRNENSIMSQSSVVQTNAETGSTNSEESSSDSFGKKRRIVCGVDGTVYRKHPTFSKHLKEYTNCLIPRNIELEYVLSHDGSGKGAALTALTNGVGI